MRTVRTAAGVAIAALVLVLLSGLLTGAAHAATVTHHTANITARVSVVRGHPEITVTVHRAPACITDPTVVATHNGEYVFWDALSTLPHGGNVLRGHRVDITLTFPVHGTWRDGSWHVLSVDGMPCGHPDGQYSWPVSRTVRIR